MEVTKETVLESMNTYCTERKYGSENLTDGFKEKFSKLCTTFPNLSIFTTNYKNPL